jgi:hypothetical protein
MGGECSQKLRPWRGRDSSPGRSNLRLSRKSTLYRKDLVQRVMAAPFFRRGRARLSNALAPRSPPSSIHGLARTGP